MTLTLTRTLNLGAAILCVIASAFVLAEAQSANIQIIPAPKQLNQVEAKFELGPGSRIVLADAKSAEDRFAAQDFADDLRQAAGVNLNLGGNNARREILIGQIDSPRIQQALKRSVVAVDQTLTNEGYLLAVGSN